MNVPLVIGAALAFLAAGIHGVAGETLLVRKLSPETLPATPFGGSGMMSKSMLRASWHLATIGMLAVATALLLAGTVLDGDTAHGFALLAAAMSTGFAVLVLGIAVTTRSTRSPFLHPGPGLLTAIAVMAWWGVV
jgi:hypothetical protein